MFDLEKDMQTWLELAFKDCEGLYNLIVQNDFSSEHISRETEKIIESYKYCLSTLKMVEVVSQNTNISQYSHEIIQPDFLLYSIETEAFVIVEIKNSRGATRETATELSAYSNALKSYLPHISDGDIINVIISAEWPVLLKNHVFNEIFWLNRNLLCLKPVRENEAIELRCIPPGQLIGEFALTSLRQEHLKGYQVCLYKNDIQSGGRLEDFYDYEEYTKAALFRMKNKASQLNSHGFAFLWKDLREGACAAYSITIVDVNPFSRLSPFHISKKGIGVKLRSIVSNYESTGNTHSLWKIIDSCKLYLESICSIIPEGSLNWSVLKGFMDGGSEVIEFVCWGVVLEQYEIELKIAMDSSKENISYGSPAFGRDFINKLFR